MRVTKLGFVMNCLRFDVPFQTTCEHLNKSISVMRYEKTGKFLEIFFFEILIFLRGGATIFRLWPIDCGNRSVPPIERKTEISYFSCMH